MNEKVEKIKKWSKENWDLLLGIGLAVGGITILGVEGHKWVKVKAEVNKDSVKYWKSFIPTAMQHKPLQDTITHINPWVRLIPSKWNAGELLSLDWSDDDALICIKKITADKLGILGEDLLTCAMKEGEPVDALIHIFYDVDSQH